MTDIALFCEDLGHEVVLGALVRRVARDMGVAAAVAIRSARGGRGRALASLSDYQEDVKRGVARPVDVLVVGLDANCHGYARRRDEVLAHVSSAPLSCVLAVPDPHVERWLLLDGQAFRKVLGHGCQPPDQKCEKARYKALLREAVRAAGVEPVLGGLEHADQLVAAMDLNRAAHLDRSLGRFLADLQAALRARKQG
ncbi:MAG TPA: hypothetical protein PLD23_17430 [Armatimonadota bacterium]|nr:hypothetical protein [Armatimonadota bacterium]HQK95285.1 hypothetical protein [Armatimonadota bacterium]